MILKYNMISFLKYAECKKVIFKNITFNKLFICKDPQNKYLIIEFKNCIFNKTLDFEHCKFNSIEFTNCKGKTVLGNKMEISSILRIENSSIEEFSLDSIVVDTVEIGYCKNIGIQFNDMQCGELSIYNNAENFKLEVIGFGKNEYINKIEDLYIKVDAFLTGNITIENFRIEKLLIGGKLDRALLDFIGNEYQYINIENLINNGTIKLSSPTFLNTSAITIIESDMGKAVLFGADFNQVKNFSIGKVNLNDIVYSGITWCKSINTYPDKPMSFAQLREIYKQLKNVTIKQNDKPEELRFHALEMRNYKQEMKSVKKRWNDKIILSFNQTTNDHGQSWSKALFIIIAVIIIVYFPIKILLGFTIFNLKYTPMAISEMIECFNPIRKFNDSFGLNGRLKDSNLTSCAKILDILFLRLTVGLLIFQMVKAFRKYVK